ncbi:MAG: Ig-like domain-containing protein [Methanomassiliicoccales archaeon]
MKVDFRVFSVLALAMVMLLGTLSLPALAAETAEGTWDGGVAVQKNLRDSGDPFVAQSANGNKFAVWTETDDTMRYFICYSMYTPTTGWSWPDLLDGVPSGESVSNAQVGMSDNGTAIVSWLRYTTENHLISRTYDPGNGWSEAFDHGESNSFGWRNYRLAVNGDGDALLAHYAINSTAFGAEIWTYSAGSGWEGEVLQSVPLTDNLNSIYVTLSDSGRAAASWLYTNSSNHVMVSTRSASGGWSSPAEIDDPGDYTFWIRVGIDDSSGELMVTYLKSIPPYKSTYYSVTVDGAWSAPEPVAGLNNTNAWNSNMVMNREGKAMVVTTDQIGSEWAVNVTMYDDGEWTPTISLATNLSGLYYPEIAIDELGRAVATWAAPDDDRVAATYVPDIGWSEVVPVEYNAGGATYSIGSVSLESGNILVGYYAVTSVTTIWVSSFSFPDDVPPELQVDQTSTITDRPLFEITGTTEIGATVDVNGRAAAVSDSGEFSVLVELADGANVLLVTATDEEGNVANVTLTVTYNDPVPGLEDEIDELHEDLDAANDEIASVGSTAMLMGILGVVGLVVAIVALVLVFLRRKV